MKKSHYLATLPDGTIPESAAAGTPINLADHIGQVIDHPNPCKNNWYDETQFSYFRTYTRPGEVLARLDDWPVRLWIVDPIGETGNWAPHHYPYWVLAHQLRVLEEIEPWRALGPHGDKLLDFIEQQLPEKVRQWISQWQTDPQMMQQRFTDWYQDPTEQRSSADLAWRYVAERARTSRREAALNVARDLTARAADRVLSDAGLSHGYDLARGRDSYLGAAIQFQELLDGNQRLTAYVTARATSLAAAIQFHDRLEQRELQTLAALDLDTSTPVAV